MDDKEIIGFAVGYIDFTLKESWTTDKISTGLSHFSKVLKEQQRGSETTHLALKKVNDNLPKIMTLMPVFGVEAVKEMIWVSSNQNKQENIKTTETVTNPYCASKPVCGASSSDVRREEPNVSTSSCGCLGRTIVSKGGVR